MQPAEQLVELIPPKPHSKKQALIMSAFRYPHLREIWVAMGTKWGKSIAASVCMGSVAVERPKTRWRWVAPIYEQAKVGMEYFEPVLPPPPHTLVKPGDMRIALPGVGTEIQFWHAKDPRSLEGPAIHGYVFDEAAKMAAAVRSSARTTTTFTQGPHMYICYPQGKNWFYDGCMAAREHMQWSLRNGLPLERIFLHARTEENPFIPRKSIEDARKEIPERLYRTFYMAEFLDDGAVFVGHRDCCYTPPLSFVGDRQRWLHAEAATFEVVVGADWARNNDYVVFTAIDLATGRVVGFERFHKVAYTEAIRRAVLFCRKFKTAVSFMHDKTGVGVAIDDQLAYTDLPYEGVTFSNASKSEMVAKLITSFEQKVIGIPAWDLMLGELDSFDLRTNALGQVTYGAPSGKHDDIVCSLMLANAAYLAYADRALEIKYMEDIADEKSLQVSDDPVAQFYAGLADDD